MEGGERETGWRVGEKLLGMWNGERRSWSRGRGGISREMRLVPRGGS